MNVFVRIGGHHGLVEARAARFVLLACVGFQVVTGQQARGLAEAPDGRITFEVWYRSDRMAEHSPQIRTAVDCALAGAERWSCVEADLTRAR